MEFISPEFLNRHGRIERMASLLFETTLPVDIQNNWRGTDAPSRYLVVNYFTVYQKLFRGDCTLNSSNYFRCSGDPCEKEMRQQ